MMSQAGEEPGGGVAPRAVVKFVVATRRDRVERGFNDSGILLEPWEEGLGARSRSRCCLLGALGGGGRKCKTSWAPGYGKSSSGLESTCWDI